MSARRFQGECEMSVRSFRGLVRDGWMGVSDVSGEVLGG